VKPQPLPIKVWCLCGQKYAFDVYPDNGRMPVPVACPVCRRDGTDEANRLIAEALQRSVVHPAAPVPPPRVNAVLNSVQSALAPHLVEALKNAVVQELAAQRRELLAAQQAAAAELTELARRLEAAQSPLMDRLRAYERRIGELESELGEQTRENRELLKLKIEMLREQVETERSRGSRLNFN
jgi:hypothetical protein